MPIADAPPIAAPELWLEPLDFPAWRRRLDLEHRARHLTRARRDALRALVACAEPDGTVSPTDAEVAAMAAVSARTVRRARADARELGLLDWQQTRQLVRGRWRQGRNVYAVRVPARPVSDGHAGRAKQERKIQRPVRAAIPTIPQAEAAAALAEIARRRMAALFGRTPAMADRASAYSRTGVTAGQA